MENTTVDTAQVSDDFALTQEGLAGMQSVGLTALIQLDYVPGPGKATMKAHNFGKNDIYMADPSQIFVLEGFNLRIKDDEYWTGIEALADSMEAEGFYEDKPIAVIVRPDNEGVQRIYAVEGGRRRDAAQLWQKRKGEDGKDIRVPVVIKKRTTSELDLIYGLGRGNDSVHFRPYELAVLVRRLYSSYNQSKDQIMTRLGSLIESASYFDSLLTVSGAPPYIVDLIINNKISVTEAANAMRTHGGNAVSMLKAAEANANAEGKTRITARFMPEKAFKNAVNKQAVKFYESAKQIQADPGFASLSLENQEKLTALLNLIKEEEPEAQLKAAEEGDSDKQMDIDDRLPLAS